MNKKILNTIIFAVCMIGIIVIVVLFSNKVIDTVTFFIILGAVIVVGGIAYFLINILKNIAKVEIKPEEINQEQVLFDIRKYLMYNKFIQPMNESEEIKFMTMNKELNAVYYCEDESTTKQFYIIYNLKLKLFSVFNNKLELEKHIAAIIKQQYVIRQRVVDRDSLTGREREQEEMIDKDEMDELKKLKQEKDELERMK